MSNVVPLRDVVPARFRASVREADLTVVVEILDCAGQPEVTLELAPESCERVAAHLFDLATTAKRLRAERSAPPLWAIWLSKARVEDLIEHGIGPIRARAIIATRDHGGLHPNDKPHPRWWERLELARNVGPRTVAKLKRIGERSTAPMPSRVVPLRG